jgi:transcriptional regulator PpsR
MLSGYERPQEDTITAAAFSGVNLAQPDVTLLLDMDGVIRDVTLANDVSGEIADAWRGRPWFETVAETGGSKVLRMVEDARDSGISAFRQVDQRFPSGLELPMEYTTVRLGGKSGLIAVGRNLKAVAELQSRLISAQQAMEQDYWKLREVETRYRMLFDASNEAVLLLSVDGLRIVEANPAAIRMSGLVRGRELLPEMTAEERAPFQAMLQRVRQNGRAPGTVVHLGAGREAWLARASLLPSEPGSVFMVQLAPAGSNQPPEQAEPTILDGFVDQLPDAFVVIDRDGISAEQIGLSSTWFRSAWRVPFSESGSAAGFLDPAPISRSCSRTCSGTVRFVCSRRRYRANSAARPRWKFRPLAAPASDRGILLY